ncbi:ketose-bisphosphate aldolase class-II family protein [Zea mays]|uniref:Ketose-bisphosphate aldolase class-II family protein n=6 Tax=Zea mays TaxID=4577 RepID=A0A1D6LWN2_MAIZE|nr:ketose-bisphosphate aldolase class-II family protein [Zea mays]
MSLTAAPVAFIGLDELSVELAASFLRSGACVRSFTPEAERSPSAALAELNGLLQCASPVEAARDAALVVVLSDAGGVDELFFGVEGIAKGLCAGSIVLIHSTLLPSQLEKLEQELTDQKKDVFLLDGYIFTGLSDELKQQIIIVASGRQDIAEKASKFFHGLYKTIYFAEGEFCTSRKIRMVNDLLEGIHFVASIEAMYLGVRAGIHPTIIYDIISNAAGSSRIFVELVPKLLSEDPLLIDFLKSTRKKASHVMDMSKSVTFPLPLLGVAYQQLVHGSSAVTGDGSASPLKNLELCIQVWEASFGVNIVDAAGEQIYDASKLADQLVAESKAAKRIGFIGLGAMGFGMASHLLKSGFCVVAYDVYKPTMARFADLGGSTKGSPEEIAKDVEILIIMVANESQADSVLFGNAGAVPVLSAGTSVILSSTVSPGFVIHLNRRLEAECRQIKLVDAPVSGGVKRAADGTLTIMTSGTDEALHCTGSVLSALSEKLYVIKGGCGAASSVKMVNQLLAGVHIASAAEAMSFAARLNLRTRRVFEIMQHARGYSWMFGNRVPHMLDNDYTPYSAVDIFVKDLGIVSCESSNSRIPVHVSSIAHQLFISGSASGWGRYDDAAVVKVYETLTGVKVEGKAPMLSKEDVLQSLPSEWPEDPIDNLVPIASHSSKKFLVVLDDDPTGTQTVHDIEVLTEWPVEALVEQFLKLPTCFFILTNSRSMTADKAMLLVQTICKNLKAAAEKVPGVSYTIVLRGDSTLRGHFPEEADAAVSVLGEMDAWIICPFFLQGGRYTINDIHYVADSDRLIPAGETEFAKDAVFGYKSSNLRQWVEEKTKGRVLENQVSTISITLLRKQGPTAVCEHLCSLEKGSVCIVNAASDRDMAVFASGMIQAELKGKRFLCRTAASFVSARIGIKPKPPICPNDLGLKRALTGGLIIVGSYVPKTTKQVDELRSQFGQSLRVIEVSVEMVSMKSMEDRDQEIRRIVELGNAYIQSRKDTLILTSRQLITGKTPEESLEINYKVSSALVEIVRRIDSKPHYIIAKGGITSSDIATKALEAKRAKVMGQALAGVPLWQLGPESRFPGVPYIVFPGNVGDNSALAKVVKSWASPSRSSTKEILLNAEKGGYAVGAFNVYNLEGIEAVVAAAEAEKSPAILQIHPSALKQGGVPLVACCIAAAEQSSVPISVHYDHGISKSDLLQALEAGFDSVMVDGSHLTLGDNILYTKSISSLAHAKGLLVEAELGRLSGSEDGMTVEEYEARFTDVAQAEEFIDETSIDALAVCIGNVHGKYPPSGPNLKFDLLKDLRALTLKKGVSLVLHGASGLSHELVKECIDLGVRKFNVNTEVRNSYLASLRKPEKDLIQVMASAKEAMKAVVAEKLRLFGSCGKA